MIRIRKMFLCGVSLFVSLCVTAPISLPAAAGSRTAGTATNETAKNTLAPPSMDFSDTDGLLSGVQAKKIAAQHYQKYFGEEQPVSSPLYGGYNPDHKPFLVETNRNRGVLKVENFHYPNAALSARVARTLVSRNLNGAVDVIANDNGEDVTSSDSAHYVLYQYSTAGRVIPKSRAKPREWRGMMKMLALADAALADLPKPQDLIHPPDDPRAYVHRKEYVDFGEALKDKPAGTLTRTEQLYLSVYEKVLCPQLDVLETSLSPDTYQALPSQVIYGECGFGNMRFDEEGNVAALYDFSGAGWAPRIQEFQGPILFDGAATYSKEDLIRAVALYSRYATVPLSDDEIRKIPEILRGTYLERSRRWFWKDPHLGPAHLDTNDELFSGIAKEVQAFARFAEDFSDGSGDAFLREVKQAMALPESWENSFVEDWKATLYARLPGASEKIARTKARQIQEAQVMLSGGERKPFLPWLKEVMPEDASAVLHGSFVYSPDSRDIDIKIIVPNENFRSRLFMKDKPIVRFFNADGTVVELPVGIQIVGLNSPSHRDKFLANKAEEGIIVAGRDFNLCPSDDVIFRQADQLISQAIYNQRLGKWHKAVGRLLDGLLLIYDATGNEDILNMARQLQSARGGDQRVCYRKSILSVLAFTHGYSKRPAWTQYENDVHELIAEAKELLSRPAEPLERSVLRLYHIGWISMTWGGKSLMDKIVAADLNYTLNRETIEGLLAVADKWRPSESHLPAGEVAAIPVAEGLRRVLGVNMEPVTEGMSSHADLASQAGLRDLNVDVQLKNLRSRALKRKERLAAARFIKEYLQPQEAGKKLLGPVIREELAQELWDLAAKKPLDQDFHEQLDILAELAQSDTADVLVDYLVTKTPDGKYQYDESRAFVSSILAQKFTRGWRCEWMGKANITKIVDYTRGIFLNENIKQSIEGGNDADSIFHNLTTMWEETRNPEMIGLLIEVIARDQVKSFTMRAGTALKDSWALYPRKEPGKKKDVKVPEGQAKEKEDRNKKVNEWVEALRDMVLVDKKADEEENLVQRVAAVSALGGVRENALAVQVIARILVKEKPESFVYLKALEVLELYAKRGDLSNLSLSKSIDAIPLLVFLKHTAVLLAQDQCVVATAMQLGKEKTPSLNVVDVAELFGSILSVMIRDGHAAGPYWENLQGGLQKVFSQVTSGALGKAPPAVKLFAQDTITKTSLWQIVKAQAREKKKEAKLEGKVLASEERKKKTHVSRSNRLQYLVLCDYYSTADPFVKETLASHNPYESFLRGLFVDVSLRELQKSPMAASAAGKMLVDRLVTEMGDFAQDVRRLEKIIGRIGKGTRAYGLRTWQKVVGVYLSIMARMKAKNIKKNISSNRTAFIVWQRDLNRVVVRALLDEWDVDSPPSRGFTQVKLMHAIEIIPKKAYDMEFEHTAGVTVDDRWIILPDTLFNRVMNLPGNVTTVAHEAQHWLSGADDIGMLSAAVLYGIGYDLRTCLAAKPQEQRPLEEILGKMQRKEPLNAGEESLVGGEFKAGAELAFRTDVRNPTDGILKIFQNFAWPVHDWDWGREIMAARRLVEQELVMGYTPQGNKYQRVNTYKEGEMLAGYLMGLSVRAGYFDGWQVFAELLAKHPEKYKGKNKRRLNPAEAYFVVHVLGHLMKDNPQEIHQLSGRILAGVKESVAKEPQKYELERDEVLTKRVTQKIYDFMKRNAADIELNQNSACEEIEARADTAAPELRQKLLDPAWPIQAGIVSSILYDLENRRPAPFAVPVWKSVVQAVGQARGVEGGL